ncbi:rhodanese-like domain-containing protein [Spirulina subsalsa FACHB-351]|uniref:Rhodanese-like domain-containing protein n=1 Tax=Spirulina subsalsa FACHB-351 TaxID=234711 RepID=A0ABT3L2D6_9CYAN|nr:rhodanese-like domain-containing protein [Spirulina subsalsa]MCW6035669.1 rhodanese-like domain-containing protein [Spirulina subsalsa FACHB-351]
MTNVQNRLKNLDPATLYAALEQDKVYLIDVREPSEFAGERIHGATRVSLSSFEADRIPQDAQKQLVLYCQHGNRSSQAAQKLFMAGFEKVSHLEGGLNNWKQQGYPTFVNKKAPISIMRQVQIIAGSLMLTGTILGAFVSPWFLLLSGFVGAGLTFAGVTGTCAMARILSKLPYNQV